MLTVPEAARRLGKHAETVRRWIREGKLRSSKVGTQHLIDEEDLELLLEDEHLPVPDGWKRMMNGAPMPNVVSVIRRQRAEH
jgi:excisionase family DNA binding protein